MVVGGGGAAAPLPCARGDEMKRTRRIGCGARAHGVDRDVSRAGGVRLSGCKKKQPAPYKSLPIYNHCFHAKVFFLTKMHSCT
jgi:hypothetical protein